MTVAQMRQNLINAYPGHKWEKKVNEMTDEQVVAIHARLTLSGKI